MQVIINYLDDMLFFIVIALPLVLVWRLFRWKKRGFEWREWLHELGIFILVLVIVGLFSQTILPKNGLAEPSIEHVNLEFFRVFRETYNAIIYLGFWEPFYINFLGNIVLFIPIGFLLPLLFAKLENGIYTVLIGLGLSLFIEIMQLPQQRSSDVDDLWLNATGALVGFVIYRIVKSKYPAFARLFKKLRERSL